MKSLLFIWVSLVLVGCSTNPNIDSEVSNTEISGEVVVYTQKTF